MEVEVGRTGNGVPFVRTGGRAELVVLNGGQGFVRRPTPERLTRDAVRVARMLPKDASFVLLGYDPGPASTLSIDDIVSMTGRALHELSGGRRIDLVGLSYGGMVACRIAAEQPELVRRLVLAASADRFSARGQGHVRRQLAMLEVGDVAGFAGAFGGLFRRSWYNWLLALTVRLRGARTAEGMAPTEVVACYLAAMVTAKPVDLATVRAPALVIAGMADQFFGDGTLEEAAAAIAHGELRLLPGETHMAPLETPQAFRTAMTAFLKPSGPCVGDQEVVAERPRDHVRH